MSRRSYKGHRMLSIELRIPDFSKRIDNYQQISSIISRHAFVLLKIQTSDLHICLAINSTDMKTIPFGITRPAVVNSKKVNARFMTAARHMYDKPKALRLIMTRGSALRLSSTDPAVRDAKPLHITKKSPMQPEHRAWRAIQVSASRLS